LISTSNKKIERLVIIVFLTFFTGIGCMEKSKLDQQEKERLKDISNFNITIGQKGWHIENRILEGEDLSGIKLDNSSMKHVEMDRVDMARSEITNSIFEDVRFAGSDVSNSQIKDSEFKSCQFILTKFAATEFTGCVFRGCKTNESRMEGAVFRDCKFIDFSDDSGFFDSSRWNRCRVEKSEMLATSFYYAKLEDVDFNDVVMDGVTFSEAGFKNVTLLGATANSCDFSGSKIEKLAFQECTGEGISFFNAEMSGVKFSKCKEFKELGIIQSSGSDIMIENCEGFFEPRLSLSSFENVVISGCGMKHLILNGSRFFGRNLISDSEIDGMNWSDSETNGMTIENSGICDYLILVGASFEKLVLKDVRYAGDLKVTADSVSYADSDSFPTP
jgi:uncharacterized protein YjbI with pentapeptide repeats